MEANDQHNQEMDPISLSSREQFPQLLHSKGLNGTWVELGVAKGKFSAFLIKKGKPKLLYSIDRWDGTRKHDTQQYLSVVRRFADRKNVKVVRAFFEEALVLFEDATLDFCYIDGFAFEGLNNGLVLRQWWEKIKPGGIFAGHDFSPKYPRLCKVVQAFAEAKSLPLGLTRGTCPSWWMEKPNTRISNP